MYDPKLAPGLERKKKYYLDHWENMTGIYGPEVSVL